MTPPFKLTIDQFIALDAWIEDVATYKAELVAGIEADHRPVRRSAGRAYEYLVSATPSNETDK
jgi:hypothetical protein